MIKFRKISIIPVITAFMLLLLSPVMSYGVSESVITNFNTIYGVNDMKFNKLNNKLYVVNKINNSVQVFDTNYNSSDKSSTIILDNNPVMMNINEADNKLYLLNQSSNSVSVLNGYTNDSTALNSFSTGKMPVAIAVNSASGYIYVSNRYDNTVSIVDGKYTDYTHRTTVTSGASPCAIAVNQKTNKIYVTNLNSKNVSVIDGVYNDNSHTVTVGVGNMPYLAAVNEETNKIYVANKDDNTISVIDGNYNDSSHVAQINVGTTPSAIAVNDVTNKIYVANQGSNTVSVIDGQYNDNSHVQTLKVGKYPVAIAINKKLNKVYVANSQSDYISVIDGQYNDESHISSVTVGDNPFLFAVDTNKNRFYTAVGGSGGIKLIGMPAPKVNSIATSTDGSSLILTFDSSMADPSGCEANFNVMVNGNQDKVTAASLDTDKTKIVLKLETIIKTGDSVFFEYTPGLVASEAGSQLNSIYYTGVDNTVQKLKPAVKFAETSQDGNVIFVHFNMRMKDPIGNENFFKVNVDGAYIPVSAANLNSDNSIIELNLQSPVKAGQKVTVTYSKNTLTTADGEAMEAFDAITAKNSVKGTGASQVPAVNTPAVQPVQETKDKLKDISAYKSAEKQITYAVQNGLIKLQNADKFEPTKTVTRGEFIYGLMKASGINITGKTNFADVSAGAYYYNQIAAAKALKIVTSTNNKFMPERAITNQEMMDYTVKVLKLTGKLKTQKAVNIKVYKDYKNVAQDKKTSVALFMAQGIVKSKGMTISPLSSIKRADEAIILYSLK